MLVVTLSNQRNFLDILNYVYMTYRINKYIALSFWTNLNFLAIVGRRALCPNLGLSSFQLVFQQLEAFDLNSGEQLCKYDFGSWAIRLFITYIKWKGQEWKGFSDSKATCFLAFVIDKVLNIAFESVQFFNLVFLTLWIRL